MNHEMMGDLPGHIFPGLAFIAWAAIWCFVLFRRGGNALTDPWSTRADAELAGAPPAWESAAKIIIPLLEMAGELRWVTWPMNEASTTIYAHITMDVAVIFSGIMDRLVVRGRMPAGSDRIALAIAFFVPALLFGSHGQHGPVAVTAHSIFAWALFAAGVLVVVEHLRPAPLFRWMRVYVVALAGAWFMHTGWMLYVADYDMMSNALVPRTYLFFTWYAGAIAVLLAAVISLRRSPASSSPAAH